MGETLIHALAIGEPFRVPAAGNDQLPLVTGISLAEDDQTGVAGQHPVDRRQEEVDPLLLRESGNHRENGSSRFRSETEFLEEGGAAGGLARKVARSISLWKSP